MDITQITKKVRRELRKKEKLPARDLAARAGLETKQIARALGDLVESGEAIRHQTRGSRDRAPRYTKA